MIFSNRGIQVLKQLEGFSATPYYDSAGVLTIGYGTTRFPKDLKYVTEAQAEILLRADIGWAERAVNRHVTATLNQNQFDALVIFTYNVGAGAFTESTLLRKLNDKQYESAAEEFGRWVFAKGKKIDGLVNRRAAEKKLFLET